MVLIKFEIKDQMFAVWLVKIWMFTINWLDCDFSTHVPRCGLVTLNVVNCEINKKFDSEANYLFVFATFGLDFLI